MPAPNYYEDIVLRTSTSKKRHFFQREEERNSFFYRSPPAHTHTHTQRERERERRDEDRRKESRSREKMMEQARTTNERGKGELWRVVTDHPDIFDTHVVSKLNCNEVKFFYDVNRESRAAIKRSGVRLADAFKIGDFDTTSTLSWALEKCSENTKVRFCARMARNGRLDMLRFLCDEGCPWDRRTCFEAAYYGHLECLKYAHENGCPGSANYAHLLRHSGNFVITDARI